MGEFKGTKGPWILQQGIEENRYGAKYMNIDFSLFETECVNVFADINDNLDILQANALLISKAPEMLEMLKDIIDLFEDGSLKSVDPIKRLIKEATEVRK